MQQAFTYPWMLLGLTVLPVLSVLAWLALRRRQRALVQIGGLITGVVLARQGPSRLRHLCLSLGLSALALGMAGPRWGRDWRQSAAPGRDVVVVVDLSRSMYAGAPSRVELARLSLFDLADALRRRGGHRLGLVGFAGQPRLLCPLTHDLDHFREAVAGIDAEVPDASLGVGTRIGAALTFALSVFDGRPGSRDILLLSDGDDPNRDGEFRSGAESARAEGVPVHCIALGDPDEGQRIPAGKGWLTHEGHEVRSRLEEAPLREIAQRSRGELVQARTRPVSLGERYLSIAAEGQEESPDTLPVLQQRQEWFLLPAFILLTLSLFPPVGGVRGQRSTPRGRTP